MLRLLKQLIIPLFLKLSPLIFLKLNFELFPEFSKVKISLKPSFRAALKFWSFKEVENFEKKRLNFNLFLSEQFLSQITRRMNNIWFIQLEYWVLQFILPCDLLKRESTSMYVTDLITGSLSAELRLKEQTKLIIS